MENQRHGNLSTEEVEEEKRKIEFLMKASDDVVDQVVKMSPLEICKKLESIGVKETNRFDFRNLTEEGTFSPQPVVEHWVKQIEKETGVLEKVFLEACAARLWQVWLKDRPLDRSIHFLYQAGYQALTDKESDRALQAWQKLWELLECRGYIDPGMLPESLELSEPPGVSLELVVWAEDFRKLTKSMGKEPPF